MPIDITILAIVIIRTGFVDWDCHNIDLPTPLVDCASRSIRNMGIWGNEFPYRRASYAAKSDKMGGLNLLSSCWFD